jgi:ABC-type Na+ efflux pump permease subunit
MALLAVVVLLFAGGQNIEIGVLMPPAPGPYSEQLVQVLTAKTGVPMYFEVVTTDPAEAQALFEAQRIFAIVSIPPEFDALLSQEQPAPLDFQFYNGMADVSKNVRLSFYRRLQEFYETALPEQVRVSPRIVKLPPCAIPRSSYLAVGVLVYALMFGGIIYTGVMTAKEWEYRTLPELLVSPTCSSVLIGGKMLAGLIQAGISTTIVFVVAYFLTGLRPRGNLLLTLVVLFLVGLMFVSLGALVGVIAKRFYLVLPASGITSIVLWFLCGGFVEPAAVKGTIVYGIARVLPPTYAFDALHTAMHSPFPDGVGLDMLVLTGSALVSTVVAVLVLRRQMGV